MSVLIGAPWLHAMARVFDNADAPLYLVGGAVRNPLMGLPVSDIDVCGPTRAEAVCALCEGTEVRARIRTAELGTVELYITDSDGCEHMAEYTAWRRDLYLQGHRPERVEFTTDIAVDASRRDFSVNALYQRVHADGLGEVIDPTGGLAHLRHGMLHTVKADPDLVLGEDGQRILRAVRFQSELDLVPSASMLDSLARNAHLLNELSREQLRDEFGKILMADFRYPSLPRRVPATYSGLRTLHVIGAWECLFGDLPFDEEAALALSRLENSSLAARMALLFRAVSFDAAEQAMRQLRFPAKETTQIGDCLKAMHGFYSAPLTALARLGRPALEMALAVLRAIGDEAAVQAALRVLDKLAAKPLSLRELAVSGSDLQPVFHRQNRPMREMGGVLDALWLAVLEDRIPNEREAILRDPIVSGGVQNK
ncbi:MAG: hypothetical protein IKK75_11255 [Clostridia bacterium]|nr:hypothetical protein [Clostridia bacterium]